MFSGFSGNQFSIANVVSLVSVSSTAVQDADTHVDAATEDQLTVYTPP